MFQPYTTDRTPDGMRRACNNLRAQLWADKNFAHAWLCHHWRDAPHDKCPDGCDLAALPERGEFYQSELEKGE
jgi:hypothetical protein